MNYPRFLQNICCTLLLILAACSGGGNLDNQLVLESLSPDNAVYEPGQNIVAVTKKDCSDCDVVFAGQTLTVDYTLSGPLKADFNINSNDADTDMAPVFQIPARPCTNSTEESCNVEVSVSQGKTKSNVLIITVKALSDVVKECEDGQLMINGVCPTPNCTKGLDGLQNIGCLSCLDDSECKSDNEQNICLHGFCMPKPELPPGGCHNDSDCSEGSTCVDGLCEVIPDKHECEADNDCGADFTCKNYLCKKNNTPLDTTKPDDKKRAYEAFTRVVSENNNTYSCKAGEVLLVNKCITEKACQEKSMIVVVDKNDSSRKYCFCELDKYFEVPKADVSVECKASMDAADRTDVINGARAGGDSGTYWRSRMDRHDDDAGYQEAMGGSVIENGMASRSGSNPNVTIIERNKPDGRTDRSGVTPEGLVIVKPNLNIPDANKKGFEGLIDYAGSVKGANECADGSALGPNKECMSAEECADALGEIVSDRMNGAICLCQDGFSFGDASRKLVCKQLDEITDEDYRNRIRNLRTGGRTTTWESVAAKDNEAKDDSGTYVGGLVAVAVNMDVLWDIKLTGAPIVVPQPGYDNVPKNQSLDEAIEKKKKEYLDNRFCTFDSTTIIDQARAICLSALSENDCKSSGENNPIVKAILEIGKFMDESCPKIQGKQDFGKDVGVSNNSQSSWTNFECGTPNNMGTVGATKALTGLKIKSGAVVDSLQLQCSDLKQMMSQDTYPISSLAKIGGNGGSKETMLQASHQFVLTGFNVRTTSETNTDFKAYGKIIKDIQLKGQRLKPWGISDKAIWKSNWISSNNNRTTDEAASSCAAGQLMTGLRVKYGNFIEAMMPICRPISTKMAAPDSNNMWGTGSKVTNILIDNDIPGQYCRISCPSNQGIKGVWGMQNTDKQKTPFYIHKVTSLNCEADKVQEAACMPTSGSDSKTFFELDQNDSIVIGLKGKGIKGALSGFQLIVAPYDSSAKATDEDPIVLTNPELLSYSEWAGGLAGEWLHTFYKYTSKYKADATQIMCPDQQRLTGISFRTGTLKGTEGVEGKKGLEGITGIESIECKPFEKKK